MPRLLGGPHIGKAPNLTPSVGMLTCNHGYWILVVVLLCLGHRAWPVALGPDVP